MIICPCGRGVLVDDVCLVCKYLDASDFLAEQATAAYERAVVYGDAKRYNYVLGLCRALAVSHPYIWRRNSFEKMCAKMSDVLAQ